LADEFFQSDDETMTGLMRQLLADVQEIKKENQEIKAELNVIKQDFPLREEETKRLVCFSSMIESLGKGGVDGLEVIRENHKWLRMTRERSSILATGVILAFVTSILGGVSMAIWLGVRAALVK